MSCLKVGDTVKIVGNTSDFAVKNRGKIGVITHIGETADFYAILDFDDKKSGVWLSELIKISDKKIPYISKFAKFIKEIETKKGEVNVDIKKKRVRDSKKNSQRIKM